MKDTIYMTDDELVKLYHTILAKCAHWRSCQDGSYEMALHNYGFGIVCKELDARGLSVTVES